MIRFTAVLFLSFYGLAVQATEGAHGAHSNEIPSVVLWQFINLSILFVALVYLLKDKVRATFADRQRLFLAEAEKSKVAQAEAERGYLEIKKRLEQFNAGVDSSVLKARSEAQDLKNQMITESKTQAQKIKEEAVLTAKNESLRAQRKLHSQIVTEVLGMARNVLAKDIGTNDHQKLQSDFSKNIQAVNP